MKIHSYILTPSVNVVFTQREAIVLLRCAAQCPEEQAFQAVQPAGLIARIHRRCQITPGEPYRLSCADVRLLCNVLSGGAHHPALADTINQLHAGLSAQLAELVEATRFGAVRP